MEGKNLKFFLVFLEEVLYILLYGILIFIIGLFIFLKFYDIKSFFIRKCVIKWGNVMRFEDMSVV